MRLSDNYLLRKIKDEYFLIPVGQEILNFKAVSKINEEAYLILKQIENDGLSIDQIVNNLTGEFGEIKISLLQQFVTEFINDAIKVGFVFEK